MLFPLPKNIINQFEKAHFLLLKTYILLQEILARPTN